MTCIVDYDERSDSYFPVCCECGWQGHYQHEYADAEVEGEDHENEIHREVLAA